MIILIFKPIKRETWYIVINVGGGLSEYIFMYQFDKYLKYALKDYKSDKKLT